MSLHFTSLHSTHKYSTSLTHYTRLSKRHKHTMNISLFSFKQHNLLPHYSLSSATQTTRSERKWENCLNDLQTHSSFYFLIFFCLNEVLVVVLISHSPYLPLPPSFPPSLSIKPETLSLIPSKFRTANKGKKKEYRQYRTITSMWIAMFSLFVYVCVCLSVFFFILSFFCSVKRNGNSKVLSMFHPFLFLLVLFFLIYFFLFKKKK